MAFPSGRERRNMMEREYYRIPAELLGENGKIPLRVMETSEDVFRSMASMMADCIRENNREGRRTVLICPVGPVGQYAYFVEQVNRERLDLGRVWFFNMDEYLDGDTFIDSKIPLSFRGFMDREVYGRIDPELLMPKDQRVFPDPADPAGTDRLLEELDGADIAFGGIGITGHLAFNEPRKDMTAAEFAALPTRVLEIAPETRAVNAAGELGGALECMPARCVTLGMKQILGAGKLRLGVFRDWHRAVVRRAAYGEKTAEFPVTLAQEHPDALILTNGNAARLPFGGNG